MPGLLLRGAGFGACFDCFGVIDIPDIGCFVPPPCCIPGILESPSPDIPFMSPIPIAIATGSSGAT